MASKVLGVRIPEDLADEFKQKSAEEGMTVTEMLRKLVDDTVYPPGGEQATAMEGVSELQEWVKATISAIKAELSELTKQLIANDKTKAEGITLVSAVLDTHKHGEKGAVLIENDFLSKEWHPVREFVKEKLLLRFVADRIQAVMEPETIQREKQADEKRRAKVGEEDNIREGKVTEPGWKYLPWLGLSIKKE